MGSGLGCSQLLPVGPWGVRPVAVSLLLVLHHAARTALPGLLRSGGLKGSAAPDLIMKSCLVFVQISFLGLTTPEVKSLTGHQKKLRQTVSLRQNPYK